MPNDLNSSPINMPEIGNEDAVLVLDFGILSVSEKPLVGSIRLVTKDGYYSFFVNETIANQIVQEARAFLRGDSPVLFSEP